MHIEHLKSDCDQQRLRGYLDQELSADQEAALEAHLDQCRDCRERIRQSAAEEHWWAAAGSYLKCDEVDEIAESCSIRSGRASTGHTDISHHVVLRQIREWLDPTDDPKYIGRFAGYEILGLLGKGGMGVVLKGFEPSLNRYVAIKVLAPALATSGAARRRFAREARAAAAVLHENVIAIHRVDESHGLPYLVMPFVGGVSLQRRIDEEGPLPLTAILRIGRQIAAGLAAAHAQGLVHRDIKPANILLDRGVERVTITDFGLARAADDGSLTKTGVIAGTPQYMSPEQSRGESVDARSDLFSLGSVLYAICTGRPPFRAETGYATLRRITDAEPRPVREINPEIPEWFEAIIRRLHDKEPDDRFQGAEEVAKLLEDCLAHVQQPTVAPLPDIPVSPRNTSVPSAQRTARKSRKGAIAMITTLAAGLLGLFLWQSADPPDVSGGWTGEDWGQVVFKETQSGRYEGTYTGTAGEEGGEIDLKWSRIERRFNGTWREGDDRHGKISVRLADDQLRGAWTTSDKSRTNPATPELADLLWVRADEDAIQGTWVLVNLEQVNAEPEDPKGTFKIVIAGDKITFPDMSEATFKLDSTKEPKRIEFTVERGGRTATAPGIYSLKGGELKYCLGREGDTEPPASFDIKKAAPGTFPTCWSFRRREEIAEEAAPRKAAEFQEQGKGGSGYAPLPGIESASRKASEFVPKKKAERPPADDSSFPRASDPGVLGEASEPGNAEARRTDDLEARRAESAAAPDAPEHGVVDVELKLNDGTRIPTLPNEVGVAVRDILAFKPDVPGIDYDQPTDGEIEACRVVLESGEAWTLLDRNLVLLRRFVDTNRDGVVDLWVYYKSGKEVYREADTDYDGKIDYREGVDDGTDDGGRQEGPVSPAFPLPLPGDQFQPPQGHSRPAEVPAVGSSDASPVTLDVVQPEPAAAREPSGGAESKGGDGREVPRAESAAPDVPSPKDLPQERAVSTRDHAALQGSWTLESIDGKQVENGRTIKFDEDTVTGLFLDEEKTPRVLMFRLLAEDAVKGFNVGPQLAPNKDDGFKRLGIYELESDKLKLAFLPKLDARNPPPGLDREHRPRDFDPKLVQIWEFRKSIAPEEPPGNAGTDTTKR